MAGAEQARLWVFGYGSLVNHHTHAHRPAVPARLAGWRREWVLTSLRPVAFLSVRSAAGDMIEGLAAPVPGGDWAALDARERAYARRHLVIAAGGGGPESAAVYAVAPEFRAAEHGGCLLLSYLDVVVEGFFHHYGRAGVERFFATTDGWSRPVEDDRAAPRYPRHRPIAPGVRALADRLLAASGAQ